MENKQIKCANIQYYKRVPETVKDIRGNVISVITCHARDEYGNLCLSKYGRPFTQLSDDGYYKHTPECKQKCMKSYFERTCARIPSYELVAATVKTSDGKLLPVITCYARNLDGEILLNGEGYPYISTHTDACFYRCQIMNQDSSIVDMGKYNLLPDKCKVNELAVNAPPIDECQVDDRKIGRWVGHK